MTRYNLASYGGVGTSNVMPDLEVDLDHRIVDEEEEPVNVQSKVSLDRSRERVPSR